MRSYQGIGSPGVEIRFPLSPRHALILRERTVHQEDARLDGRPVELTPQDVANHNLQQVMQSTRQVYSLEEDFQPAAAVCARRPDICDPNREYMKVLDHGDIIQFRRIR